MDFSLVITDVYNLDTTIAKKRQFIHTLRGFEYAYDKYGGEYAYRKFKELYGQDSETYKTLLPIIKKHDKNSEVV